MGSSLPRALTLPCREGELQRAKENPSWPSCSSPGERRERGWGLRLEANTAEIAVPFLPESERKRVKGTSEPPLHHLADIFPVCPELRSYGDRSEVEGGMPLPPAVLSGCRAFAQKSQQDRESANGGKKYPRELGPRMLLGETGRGILGKQR